MERMMHEAMNVYKYQFLTVVPDWAEDYAPNGKAHLRNCHSWLRKLTTLQGLSSKKVRS
jgi:hypothetical protein